MSNLHEAARQWSRILPIFPCLENQKVPATPNGFKDASQDPEQIDKWWTENPNYNIAASPDGAGCCVLDVDGAIGEDTLFAHLLEHGPLPPFYEVTTPRGGRHIWLKGRLRPTQGLGKRGLGDGLDTRGADSYVLLTPSIVNGNSYRPFALPNIASLGGVPDWVVKGIARRTDAIVPDVVPKNRIDRPDAIMRGRTHLQQMVKAGRVSVSDKGGNNFGYDAACELGDMALSVDTIFNLMSGDWNAACKPPWSLEELRRIVENSGSYRRSGEGAWATEPPEIAFANLIENERLIAPAVLDDLALIPFTDLINHQFPPVEELVAGWIEKGIPNFLCGPGGSAKSRLALQIAMAVNCGGKVLGQPVVQSRAIYVSSEDEVPEIGRRMQAIAAKTSYTPPGAHVIDRVGKLSALASMVEGGDFTELPFLEQLRKTLKGIEGHKLVVLDSCYNYVHFLGRSKIDEGAVQSFIMNVLQKLCTDCDCTLLVIWHPSQSGSERKDGGGWSVAWHNTPRRRIYIERTEDGFEVSLVKHNHTAPMKPITLTWQQGALLPLTVFEETEQTKGLMEILMTQALRAADTGQPLQRQKQTPLWVVDKIEKLSGQRLSNTKIKELLEQATDMKFLRYLTGNRNMPAGYYPYPVVVLPGSAPVAGVENILQDGDSEQKPE